MIKASLTGMMYFWLIPLVLLLVVAVVMMRKGGTKRIPERSNLDKARQMENR